MKRGKNSNHVEDSNLEDRWHREGLAPLLGLHAQEPLDDLPRGGIGPPVPSASTELRV